MAKPRKKPVRTKSSSGATGSNTPANTPPKSRKSNAEKDATKEDDANETTGENVDEPMFLICDGTQECLNVFIQLPKEGQLELLDVSAEDVDDMCASWGVGHKDR